MPIRFCVIGTNKRGAVVERWFLRSAYLIDVARAEMQVDAYITRITVVAICLTCGSIRVGGRCLNNDCLTRQKWLEASTVSVTPGCAQVL